MKLELCFGSVLVTADKTEIKNLALKLSSLFYFLPQHDARQQCQRSTTGLRKRREGSPSYSYFDEDQLHIPAFIFYLNGFFRLS